MAGGFYRSAVELLDAIGEQAPHMAGFVPPDIPAGHPASGLGMRSFEGYPKGSLIARLIADAMGIDPGGLTPDSLKGLDYDTARGDVLFGMWGGTTPTFRISKVTLEAAGLKPDDVLYVFKMAGARRVRG